MMYSCCDRRRRNAVAAHATLNGIDFLEVHDDPDAPDDQRQRMLEMHFLKPLAAGTLDANNVHIEGGERVRGIVVLGVSAGAGDDARVLTVEVDRAGDFDSYRLRLVGDDDSNQPPDGFDPVLSVVPFSFKNECPSEFDCLPRRICLPDDAVEPDINYLAKDYATFRQLMLDRLSVLAPQWRDRHAADFGVALVELLAYVGDRLSYQQDAVATEAYLQTARRRVSVRRHARLVDYFVHNGCNARAWVQLQNGDDGVLVPRGTQLLTRVADLPVRIDPPPSDAYERAIEQRAVAFETMHPVRLFADHNQMPFYTWGDRECCLPHGATRATLRGERRDLKAGDVLILAEVRDPGGGTVDDVDTAKRHPVRLTHVFAAEDPAGGRFLNPPNDHALPVTQIEWAAEDALPFPLCISAVAGDGTYIEEVSVAWGNIVLADHGRSVRDVFLRKVPQPHLLLAPNNDRQERCRTRSREPIPARYRPGLPQRPLTHAAALRDEFLFAIPLQPGDEVDLDSHEIPAAVEQAFLDGDVVFDNASLSVQGGDGQWSLSDRRQAWVLTVERGELRFSRVAQPAAGMWRQTVDQALPQVQLRGVLDGIEQTWSIRRDLLGSLKSDPHFVVEVESDGTAFVRFGDGRHGKRPEPGTRFTANLRTGNGPAGNVGAASIAHVVTTDPRITSVLNPQPARGGTEQESIEEVRRAAPQAFRRQQRAVTAEDYAEVAERHPGIQKAAATVRWTGSWHTVFVTVDRLGGLPVDDAFEADLRAHLERFRMAGHDLQVDAPRFVSLEIEMVACAKPDYLRSDVRAALLDVFSNRRLPDRRHGLFHPDHFTFGQAVHLSPLYAAAQTVPGVASVEIITFQRLGTPDTSALSAGRIEIGRLEIARLDNDPSFPERGVFRLRVEGGK